MNDSGQAAVGAVVALRDAHFRLTALARAWEEHAPAGSVRGRMPLGPEWHWSDRPDQASYSDGRLIELTGGLTLALHLAVRFDAAGTDLQASLSVEDRDGNVEELLCTGPEEFPASAEELAAAIGQCLDRLERLDPSSVWRRARSRSE
ncbi:hypothetical protein ACIQF6_30970 [Kitasatospora sp. NPDC092948]|uniref:hypothetical protein n=1 Tax=Kitasatospora sp. NPDC092948 TaxID=3364088 RepID=UPI0038172293